VNLLSASFTPGEAVVWFRDWAERHAGRLALVIGLLGLLQVLLALEIATGTLGLASSGWLWGPDFDRIAVPAGRKSFVHLDTGTVVVVLLMLLGGAMIAFRRKLVSEGFWTPLYLLAATYTLMHSLRLRFLTEMAASRPYPRPLSDRLLIPETIQALGQFIPLADINRVLIYASSAIFLVAFMYTMRYLLRQFFDLTSLQVMVFPIVVCLFLAPFKQYWHHYIYDYPLLLATAWMILLIHKDRMAAYYPCFALACLNKETAILMIPVVALYSLHRRLPLGRVLGQVAAHLAIFVPVKLFVNYLTAANPGQQFNFELVHNLRFLTHSQSMASVVAWLILAALVGHRWSQKPFLLRCGVVPLAVLMAMMFFVGFFDELRDYYEAVPFLLPLAYWSACHLLSGGGPKREPSGPSLVTD
jgi:hypothetical protein